MIEKINLNILNLFQNYFQSKDTAIKDQLFTQLQANYLHLDQKWTDNFISQEILLKRLDKLLQIYDELLNLSQQEEISLELLIENTWKFYLPYAQRILTDYQNLIQNNNNKTPELPLIYGLLGVQGAGKTTLGIIMKIIMKSEGINLDCISIDDFYKTYTERLELQKQDPRLVDRGPPGTHDINLALQTFLTAKQSWQKYYNKEISEPEIIIPQFDKSLHKGQGDRISSKVVKHPQIIIFEGWFLGYRYNSEINQLLKLKKISQEDYQFAIDMNEKLKDYHCLWDLLKELIILMPEKFEYSIQWRMDAEQKMKKIKGSGKSDQEIEQFVRYFFRSLDPDIFINHLIKMKLAKLVIKVNYQHQIADCILN